MKFLSRNTATKSIPLALAASLVFGFATAPMASAAETTPKVTVKKIASKKAAYGKSVTIKPNVTKAGKVKISSKKLSVKKGSKTIAANKDSVKLKAGTYKVTTTVKYKTGTKKTTTTNVWKAGSLAALTQDTAVSCTLTAVDFWFDDDPGYYDWEAVCTTSDGKKYLVSGDDYFQDEYWLELNAPSTVKKGAKFTGVLESDQNVHSAKAVKKTTTNWVYGATKTKKLTQTLKITQGAKPTRVSGSGWNCPSGYPIKGNADSGIYHVPGGAYYSKTQPEECFSSEAAAKKAGYRKSQR